MSWVFPLVAENERIASDRGPNLTRPVTYEIDAPPRPAAGRAGSAGSRPGRSERSQLCWRRCLSWCAGSLTELSGLAAGLNRNPSI